MPKNLNTERLTRNTTKVHLSDDLLFLIACCQTDLSEDDKEFIHSFIQHSTFSIAPSGNALGVQHLLALSSQHGILPLVYKTIKKLNVSSPSDDYHSSLNAQHLTLNTFLSKVKTQYMTIAQRNMLMSAELIRIIQLLEKNSIEALAFKGPTLAQMAYGDITLRQYSDLDVLVKKEDIYTIDALLKDRGYQRILELTLVQEEVYMQYEHDLGLYHPKTGVHFEMHWSLMDEDYPMQIDLATIWKNPQTMKINQQEIKIFPTEELLFYLCIHGSKHLWERIEWVKDIDLLIRKEKIDWNKIIAETDSSDFKTMVFLGLYLSSMLFETKLPMIISEKIHKDRKLADLSEYILETWRRENIDDFSAKIQRIRNMLKLFPGFKKKIIYLNRVLFKPSLKDYWFMDLPKGFYWGYYFVRIYRYIKKYLLK